MSVHLPVLNRTIESLFDGHAYVQWQQPDFPHTVVALILDEDPGNVRAVQAVPGRGFIVRGATNPDATLKDPGDRYNQRPWVFGSVDAALVAVLGRPR